MTKRIHTLDWMITKYMSFFQEFGMKETNIREYFIIWSKNRPGFVKDYLWFIFNLLLTETSKQSRTELKMHEHHWKIYSKMLEFRRKEENIAANEILQLMFMADIKKNILNTDLILKVKVISGHCCSYCDALNEKEFDPEDVIQHQYLGSKMCTREWGCNCTYTYRALKDKNGRLIHK